MGGIGRRFKRVITSGSACVTHGWEATAMTRGGRTGIAEPARSDPDVGDVAFTETVREPGRSPSSATAVLRR
jgi:hypothetical protein